MERKLTARRPLTPRRSQRRLRLELMDGLGYTTVLELAEPLASQRGSAWDRYLQPPQLSLRHLPLPRRHQIPQTPRSATTIHEVNVTIWGS